MQNWLLTTFFVFLCSTATNSHRSTPACSPVLRKRSRSSTAQLSPEADSTMVEKGSSDQASDRSPATPEQHQSSHPHHQRSYSQPVHSNNTNSSSRSGAKNSKVSGTAYTAVEPAVNLG